jgi:hypothetical protein
MKKLLLFLFLIPLQTPGQNYILYHQTFHRLDDDILENNYEMALARLDSIYENYDFVYARHCVKALQICCYIEDSLKADKWLEKSFKQGVPLWIISSNDITKRALLYSATRNTVQNFDSLYAIYKMSVNSDLANQIDSLLSIDRKYTQKVNDGFFLFRHTVYGLMWIKNNKRQFEIINHIINEHGFPGERLIGLPRVLEDSTEMIKKINFWGPGPELLNEGRAFIMLVHYFTTRHKTHSDFENMLLQNLIIGNILPYQYARLCDDIYGRKNRRYSIGFREDNVDAIKEVNSKRHSIGLNSMEQEKRNMLMGRERRGNRTANSEICLE